MTKYHKALDVVFPVKYYKVIGSMDEPIYYRVINGSNVAQQYQRGKWYDWLTKSDVEKYFIPINEGDIMLELL